MNILCYSKNISRCIVLGLFISLFPFGSVFANGSVALSVNAGEQQPQQQPEIVALKELARRALNDPQSRPFPNLSQENPVLDAHAARELQLDLLLERLDRTQTKLGSNGLLLSMIPTNDKEEIERRQALIKTFINKPHVFTRVTNALSAIAKSEADVLSYWNPGDPLYHSIKHLYFDLEGFKHLNKSKLALEAVTLFDAALQFKTLVGILFLQGLINECWNFAIHGAKFKPENVKHGLFKLINSHNPLWCNYMHEYVPGCDDAHHLDMSSKVMIGGTLKDEVLFLDQAWRRQRSQVGSVFTSVKNKIFGTPEQPNPDNAQNQQPQAQPFPWVAWTSTIAGTLYNDYMLYKIFGSNKASLKANYRNLEGLRTRMIGVADFIKSILAIERLIEATPELKAALPAKVVSDIALGKSLSPKMVELVALLKTATFKKSTSILYLRGKVLYANLLFSSIKQQLVPAMRAIAEIDAYCSIARLMKESAGNENKFTFVTFTNSAQAYLELDNCWIAALDPKEAVANSMILGNGRSGKAIITGPNGGGKSTWLKASGQAVSMAHAWGIVPARKAHMSIFDAIRTSLEPRESLEHGISKFMAQKESMDKIQDFVLSNQHKVSLVLLDEPYDGTVTDEIARRAGEFCDNVVTSNNCLAIIATHVMPNLKNPALYGWYHVDIAEPEVGKFRRTFRLRPGLAKRWFDDAAWRARFIDWLSAEMRKDAIIKARLQANA